MHPPRLTLTLVLCTATLVTASQTTAPAPTATTQRQRYVAQVPAGFKRVSIEGRELFVQPQDEAWVSQAIQNAPPTTMPTTMPADLIERLQARRGDIARRLAAELAVADPKEVEKYFDESLLPMLRRIDQFRPSLIYLVATPQRIKEIMKAGWRDPAFYYNRAADEVEFSRVLNLSLEDSPDDMVRPIFFEEGWADQRKREELTATMRAIEEQILQGISSRTQEAALSGIVDLINAKVMSPLELKDDQAWLAVGASGVVGARYVSELTGLDEARLLEVMSRVNPRNPIRPQSIDLLHPTNLSDLRPEWLPAYSQAFRARAVAAVRKLAESGGDDAIAKVIAAVRQDRPADGKGLAQLIHQTTGVDLWKELGPQ
jgi:hypothetical protein